MAKIRQTMVYDTVPTEATTTATEAIALRRGVCQDFAHVFISGARHLGLPARYVSGYLYDPKVPSTSGGHGWAEAYIEDLGWVGFDPTNGTAPTEDHIRVAVGLDYLGAAPISGTRFGGSGEVLTVHVEVKEAKGRPNGQGQSQDQKSGQGQSQSQSA
jgi:transglutaminase-like putative cysteine protease